jgi:hypothetical protein
MSCIAQVRAAAGSTRSSIQPPTSMSVTVMATSSWKVGCSSTRHTRESPSNEG